MVDEVKNTTQPTIPTPQPVGGVTHGKEQGSFVEYANPRPEIGPELVGYIEQTPSLPEIEVPYEAKSLGVTAEPSLPVAAQPIGVSKSPYSKAEIVSFSRIYKAVNDAKMWLVQFWFRQFKKQEHRLEQERSGA